jgi:hypothetical protein
MDLQEVLRKGRHTMLSPVVYRTTRSTIVVSLAAVFFLVLLPVMAIAQEAYLVTAADGSLSAYNLATNNLIETTTAGLGKGSVTVGPNQRLAFISGVDYISVLDLSIQREIQHVLGYFLESGPMVFTPDGRYLLAVDNSTYVAPGYVDTLDVFDAASLQLLHQVRLDTVLGTVAYNIPLGSLVVVGQKVYIAPQYPDLNTPAMAVVDLQTLHASAITIPAGFFDGPTYSSGNPPNAAATPDGQYVVMAETESADGAYHLLFISTATDSLSADNAITYDPLGIVISPSSSSSYGYLAGFDPQFDFAAVVIDLNPGSPTFGQLLPQTEVNLSGYFFGESGLAVNSSGSRLVVSGFHSGQSPQPNVIVIDTGQMLINPNHAIVATTTAANGAQTNAVTIATIATTMPPIAPTVRSVSGRTVNNAPITLHIFGDNFQAGARVRVGGMLPIAATVNSPRDLEITLPVNAPAGPDQDVLVTNPNLAGPPSRQYLSGVLPGAVNIQANPAFNTRYEFAAVNTQDGSVSLYHSSQRAMVNAPLNPPGYTPASFAFNAGGTDLYIASSGYRYAPRTVNLLDLNLATHSDTSITTGGNRIFGIKATVASVNPATGLSVAYEWAGYQDITVSMVDTDPSSPTFNTVIKTLQGNLGTDTYLPFSGAATPDGRYVYVNVFDAAAGTFSIDIFDVVHGGNAVVLSTSTLGVADQQFNVYVSPDGASLLLLFYAPNGAGGIKVFDISANPLNPTPVTTIVPDDGANIGLLYSFTITGNRLFAYDYVNAPVADPVWIYNFDRQHNNYSVLGSALDQSYGYGNKVIAVSPDGNLLFVPGDEAIQIFDASHIVNGQAGLITQLASYHGPAVLAVSPVAGQNLIRAYAGAPRHESPTPRVEEEKPVGEPQPPAALRRLEKTPSNSGNRRLVLEP